MRRVQKTVESAVGDGAQGDYQIAPHDQRRKPGGNVLLEGQQDETSPIRILSAAGSRNAAS